MLKEARDLSGLDWGVANRKFVDAVILQISFFNKFDRYMKIPKRSSTHRTDTLAVRAVISELPADWLIRNLEERDYGVDLQIEIFDGDEPTGQIAHIQIKGTDSAFNGVPKFGSFPVKTIGYAERFSAPFFVFHTSTKTKETYFVWLQKYAATRLTLDSPDWRSQDSVTINFPQDNVLRSNYEKIALILKNQQIKEQGLAFLAQYEWLKIHVDHIVSADNHHAAEPALENIEALSTFTDLLEKYGETLFDLDIDAMSTELLEIKRQRVIKEDQKDFLEEQLEHLYLLKMALLDEDEMDSFTVECCSEDGHPY